MSVTHDDYLDFFIKDCKKKKRFGISPSENICRILGENAWKKFQRKEPRKAKKIITSRNSLKKYRTPKKRKAKQIKTSRLKW